MKKMFVCNNCNYKFDVEDKNVDNIEHCPNCNSADINRLIILKDNISTHENISGFSNKQPGKKKPAVEFKAGQEKSTAYNKWVNKNRVIDRENNRYFECVVDPDTGEIIHECCEPLTEHFGHGSAKNSEKGN